MPKLRIALPALSVLAVAGLALGGAVAPASAATHGLVHLMVKTNARSVFVSTTTNPFDEPFTTCRTLGQGTGWKDAHQDLQLGKNVKLITFTTGNCTNGVLATRDLTVPNATSADNLWVDMS
ncbi:hypothetical protein ABZX85_38455 [Streptomyces sp. NPDC004539]|uniref:hypothetical protein n=1 Tax=Streptomyces sp. NPDC004539 TaxID=3154280 RepID=UPI0033A7D4C0